MKVQMIYTQFRQGRDALTHRMDTSRAVALMKETFCIIYFLLEVSFSTVMLCGKSYFVLDLLWIISTWYSIN